MEAEVTEVAFWRGLRQVPGYDRMRPPVAALNWFLLHLPLI